VQRILDVQELLALALHHLRHGMPVARETDLGDLLGATCVRRSCGFGASPFATTLSPS